MPGTGSARKRKRGPWIHGICNDAAAIGVTREHLWRCLRGLRHAPPTVQRYVALLQTQGRRIPAAARAARRLARQQSTPKPTL